MSCRKLGYKGLANAKPSVKDLKTIKFIWRSKNQNHVYLSTS